MKKHIMKLVAVVMTAIMVMSLVPVAALPEVNWPELLSVFGASSDVAVEEAGDVSTTDTAATTTTTAPVSELTPADTDGFYTDDAGNVYVDTDGDGVAEAVQADTVVDDEDYDIADLIEGVTLGKGEIEETVEYNADTTVEQTASGVDIIEGLENEPYEPNQTENENHPFLPDGDAWINQDAIYYGAPATPSYPFTEWAANTSFLNTSSIEFDEEGRATKWLFPDVDLIDETLWSTSNFETAVTGGGYAYNRNDPAYDKWGVTIDKNVSQVSWTLDKKVQLGDTPYLAFSIEQVDGAKTAIAVKIGTPTATGADTYTYRWYIITDNVAHPGIDYDATKLNTMQPSVQVLKEDALAFNEAAYVDGALTGCLDMVAWLPQISASTSAQNAYHIAEVCVASTGDAAASRINYLYFLSQGQMMASPHIITPNTGVDLTPETTTDADTDVNGWYNASALTMRLNCEASYMLKIDPNASGVKSYTVNGKKYVDVVIPVRKWVNTAQDARTILLQIEKMGANGVRDITALEDLQISFWGNNAGGTSTVSTKTVETGAADSAISQRNNEELLFVSGSSNDSLGLPYIVYNTDTYVASDEADRVYDTYFDYDGNHNYYDFMESPYVSLAKKTLTPGTETLNYNDFGWTYVSSVRLCMPVCDSGEYYQIHQISTRNNPDNLNASGDDGGTGAQPIVEIGAEDLQVSSDRSAAFGPYLETSKFKTVDLLDRNTTTRNTVYGKSIAIKSGAYIGTYPGYTNSDSGMGVSNNPALMTTSSAMTGIAVAHAYLSSYVTEAENWYAVMFKNNGQLQLGWVRASDCTVGTKGAFVWTFSGTDRSSFITAHGSTWKEEVYAALQDKWTWSNLYTGTVGDLTYDENAIVTQYKTGEFSSVPAIISTSRTAESCNGSNIVNNTAISTVNSTDSQLVVNNSSGQKFPVMIRTFSDPVSIKREDRLYIDITTSNASNYIWTVVRYNNAYHLFFWDGSNSFVEFDGAAKEGTTNPNFWSIAVQNSVPFTSMFDALGITGTDTSVQVVAIGYSAWRDTNDSTAVDTTFRRLEIQYKGDEWRDTFVETADGKVAEGFNILDDAFGEVTVNQTVSSYTTARGDYGWKLNLDNCNSLIYRKTLGHLRMKISNSVTDAGPDATLTLQSDRSYSTSNYKYLYYSYAMRDVETGVGAEDATNNADSNVATNGISIAISQDQFSGNSKVYAQRANGTVSVTSGNYTEGQRQWYTYLSSYSGVLNLENLGLTSFNQINFYFQNNTASVGEYYINYIYLSNVEPSEGYQTVASRKFYQNYYLMDNTLGSYARRFPTPNNPTGLVKTEEQRNNPLIIERGHHFYEGTFYNGESLYSYTTTADTDVTGDEAYKAIFFYQDTAQKSATDPDDLTLGNHEIDAYYSLDTDNSLIVQPATGGTDTVQGRWCYNRWDGGYGQGNYLGYKVSDQSVGGSLMYKYASANQVFMRNGLNPVLYQTNYDAMGGQMLYVGSDNILTENNGIIANVNNYYITSSMVLDYFTRPTSGNDVVDPWKYGYTFEGWYTDYTGYTDANGNWVEQVGQAKIHLYQKKVNPGENFFYAVWSKKTGDVEGTDTTWDKLTHTVSFRDGDGDEWYSRETNQDNEFRIKLPNVTQIVISNSPTPIAGWVAVKAREGKPDITKDSVVYTAGTTITITDSYYFYPVTMKEWQELNPTTDENGNVIESTYNIPHTITVTDGHLEACHAQTKNWFEITETSIPGVEIFVTDGATTYANIPHMAMLRVVATTADSAKCWSVQNPGDSTAYSVNNTGNSTGSAPCYNFTIASYQSTYQFSAYTNMKLTYDTQGNQGSWSNHEMKDANGVLIFTAPRPYVQNRQMMFTSQFEIPDAIAADVTVQSFGTLYTKSSQFTNIVGTTTEGMTEGTADYNRAVANALGNAMRFVDAEGAALLGDITDTVAERTLPSTVRNLTASACNESNQYYLMVTENKGNAVTYYARGYVIYTYDGNTYITYSDIISVASVEQSTSAMTV